MADIRFKSIGEAMRSGLENFMIAEEVKRRTAMLDQITLDAEKRRAEEAKYERERQEWRDATFGEDRQRQIANEERDYNDRQQRQRIEDERYTAGQQQRQAERADQRAERYLDVERGYAEADKRREFEANESARARADRQRESDADRANARYVVDKQMAGKSTVTDASEHNPAAITIDGLDELSERINQSEGLAAKASGSWKAAAASANYDDDLAEYTAMLDGAIPLIARKMGHSGVLTQADVDSVKAMFPKAGDSKSLRDRKMKRIRSLMNMPGASGGITGGDTRVRRFNPQTGRLE